VSAAPEPYCPPGYASRIAATTELHRWGPSVFTRTLSNVRAITPIEVASTVDVLATMTNQPCRSQAQRRNLRT
jgi:hypothetical protein